MASRQQAQARRLEYVLLDDVVPADLNPKRHDLAAIGRSIGRFGYVEPIVLDERTGRLVAGHGRLEQLTAARDAGEDAPDGVTVDGRGDWRVPVIRGWASESDADAAAYLTASNRLVELGGWDDAELGSLLATLNAADPDLPAILGFEAAELSRLLLAAQGGPEQRTSPDEAPSVPAEPVTRLGDAWVLGPHRLVCGDATDPSVVGTAMAGQIADCVWTDPPYGVAYVGGGRAAAEGTERAAISNDALAPEQLRELLSSALNTVAGVCRAGAAWYVAGPGQGPPMRVFTDVLDDLGVLRQLIVWVKESFVMGRADYHGRFEPLFYGWLPGAAHHAVKDRTQDTVWEIARPKRSAEHPTMKPVALITRALENSTDHGAFVLDPFAGSGSTLIACHVTGRIARLVELDPAYCDVICHRYQAHTGDKPILEATGEPHDFTEA